MPRKIASRFTTGRYCLKLFLYYLERPAHTLQFAFQLELQETGPGKIRMDSRTRDLRSRDLHSGAHEKPLSRSEDTIRINIGTNG